MNTAPDQEGDPDAQAVLQAMMADIGVGRLDELPMEDDFRKRHGPIAGSNHRSAQFRRPMQHPQQQVNTLWRVAQESGVFDDEDAAEVKGLDDLGGGRLYDRVRNQALHILNKIPRGPPSSSGPPPKRKKGRGGKAVPVPPPNPPKPSAPHPIPARNKATNTNPTTLAHFATLQSSRPGNGAVLSAPVTVRPPDPEPEFVFKSIVRVQSGGFEAQFAFVYLCVEEYPANGRFRVYSATDGTLIGEHPISHLNNYFTATNTGIDEAVVVFNWQQKIHAASYTLQFRERDKLQGFMDALNGLRQGIVPVQRQPPLKAAAVPSKASVPVSKENSAIKRETPRDRLGPPRYNMQDTTVVHTPSPLPQPQVSVGSHPAPVAVSGELSLMKTGPTSNSQRQNQAGAQGTAAARLPSSHLPPLTVTAQTSCSHHLEIRESTSINSHSPAGPPSGSNNPATQYSRDTHRELEKVFEAAVQGAGPEVRAAVRAAIVIFYQNADVRMSREEAERLADKHITVHRCRTQYSREELFSYRDYAVSPPPYLSELRFLPQPRWAQTEMAEHESRLAHWPESQPAQVQPEQMQGLADSMAWVLNSSPRPEHQTRPTRPVESDQAQSETQSRVVAEGKAPKKPKNHMGEAVKAGLMKSIWAPANSTYVRELAQLEMNPRISSQRDDTSSASWWAPQTPLQDRAATTVAIPATPAESVVSGSVYGRLSTNGDGESGTASPTPSKHMRMLKKVLAGKIREPVVDGVDGVSESLSRLTISGQGGVAPNRPLPARQTVRQNTLVSGGSAIEATTSPVCLPSSVSVPNIVTVPAPAPSGGDASLLSRKPAPPQGPAARPKGLAASRHARL